MTFILEMLEKLAESIINLQKDQNKNEIIYIQLLQSNEEVVELLNEIKEGLMKNNQHNMEKNTISK